MDPVWDSGGQRAESRRVHYWIRLIARTCASIVDSAGNDKEQTWKHMVVFTHLPIHIQFSNNVDWSRFVDLSCKVCTAGTVSCSVTGFNGWIQKVKHF